jgi:hypothetical protein
MAFLTAHSSTALHTANAFVQTRGSRTDPVWAVRIATAERDSLLAVHTFSNDTNGGYWLRPESLAAISWAGNAADYYSGWMPHMPDRAEVKFFKQVWDYRWALPALAYAITARVAVLKIFATGSRAEHELHCTEIKSYVKILGSVFNKMSAGIRTLKKWSPLQLSWYRTTGQIPLAAADIYGGYYLGGIFFASGLRRKFLAPDIAPPTLIEYPARIEDVEYDVIAFADHWSNLIYLKIGMDSFFQFISGLAVLCDPKSYSGILARVGQTVRYAAKHEPFRKFASTAVSLSDLVATGDAVSKALLTQSLYQALSTRSEPAQEIMHQSVRDLTQLVESTGESSPNRPPRRKAAKKRGKAKSA